jgi:LPS export ABC transporter protein LptC
MVSANAPLRMAVCRLWIGFATVFTACSDQTGGAERFKVNPQVGVDRMEHVELWFYQNGSEKAQMKAGTMLWYRAGNRMEMENGFKVDVYDTRGLRVISRISAQRGLRDIAKALLEAKGSVVANNLAGDTLFTEQLFMDEKAGRIYTVAPVRIRTSREWLVGDGLEANRDMSEYRILRLKGNVRIDL